MKTVNIHLAKTQLSKLIEEASKGESFIIAKAGKPILSKSKKSSPPPRGGEDFLTDLRQLQRRSMTADRRQKFKYSGGHRPPLQRGVFALTLVWCFLPRCLLISCLLSLAALIERRSSTSCERMATQREAHYLP